MIPILISTIVVLGLIGAAYALLLRSGSGACGCACCRNDKTDGDGKTAGSDTRGEGRRTK